MVHGSDTAGHRRYMKELAENHDHNARMNLFDGLFFAMGFSCVVPGIVITSFLAHYTSNKFLLNLPVLISNIMFAVMPFLASFVSGRFKSKKTVMNTIAVFHRLAWIPVLLTIILFKDKPGILLPLFLVCYSIFYALWGASAIFWREMMGRVLHPSKQTSTMGVREAVGNIAGFVASFGVMAVLARLAFPSNYLVLFVFFIASFSLCLIWLFQLREATYPVTHHESPVRHLQSIVELPRKDPLFGWFVVFIFFSYGSLFTGSLYTTIGLDRFGKALNPDRLAGVMTILSLFSNSIFAFLLGRLADRKGRFWGYLPAVIFSILLPLWAIVAMKPAGYLAVFLFLGAINATWFMELFATLNFAPPEKRHLYIAYISLMKIIPIFVYVSLGGWIAQRISPFLTLAISSFLCLVSLAILIFKLRPHWKAAGKASVEPGPASELAG